MKKIGILLPAVNDALEYELPRWMPESVSLHFSRFTFSGATRSNYEDIANDVPRASSLLQPIRPDAAFFACTSGSLYGGLGFDRKLSASIEASLCCPTSTTSTAVVEAFQHVGARRITVLTPYPSWVDELEVQFFHDHGFVVDQIRGLGLENCSQVADAELLALADTVRPVSSGLVFVSCTGLKTLHLLPVLREKLGVPVFSSNSVSAWKLCELAGLDDGERLLGL